VEVKVAGVVDAAVAGEEDAAVDAEDVVADKSLTATIGHPVFENEHVENEKLNKKDEKVSSSWRKNQKYPSHRRLIS
jgi:hypothetical protein